MNDIFIQASVMSNLRTENTKLFKKTLIKLAAFTGVLIVNDLLFSQLLLYIFLFFGAAYLPSDQLYLVNWILNDLSAYLLPAAGALLIFWPELHDNKARIRYQDYQPVWETLLCFSAMLFTGSIATIITDFIARIADSIFGTGEIPDAMAGVAPENDINFTVFFIFVCFIGPVCEEIIFRKLLLTPMRRMGDRAAVVFSAVVFGAYHGNLDQFPYAVAVGIFLGTAAVRSDSLAPSLILHVVNNTVVTLTGYLTEAVGDNEVTRLIVAALNNMYTIAFFLGVFALVYMIVKKKFHFYNYCLPLKGKDKALIMVKSPAAYAAIVLMAMLFVDFSFLY